jgi:hypothetical protein
MDSSSRRWSTLDKTPFACHGKGEARDAEGNVIK